ncbi:hypothetical protein NMG60_11034937 [Bertholletia excelsa]
MELYGRNPARNGSQPDRAAEWGPAVSEPGIEESMRRLGSWNRELLLPERPGVPDCTYYMRTGLCSYGTKCRYNHPRDRSSVVGAVRISAGEFPERPGEPSCQFYLRTGTCKFGATCKFHHPRNGGSINNVQLNSYGFPLRPGEQQCSYYLKTGQCKFGATCKFHHPQPGGMSMPVPARPFYPTLQSSSIPSPDQYGGSSTSYRTGRPPLMPGSYVPGAYGTMLLPPGVVPIPGWSPYSGPVSPVLSPSGQPTVGASSLYGVTQLSSSASAFEGPYTPFPSSSVPSSSNQKERVFPERPGLPDCQYYLKTGDCKYGSTCRYNHPPDWVVSKTNCVLSPLGLPLRPGVQPCGFYMQKGHCKFGRTCKFDHPMGTVRYSPSASSLSDVPVTPYMVGTSLATLAPSLSYSELRPEFVSGSKLDPHSSRMPSSGSSVGLVFSQTGSTSHSSVQLSSQSSTAMNVSMSTRQGGEVRRSS